MTLDFAPRRHLVARLTAGWRLIPGHSYRPDDWAILMVLSEAEPMTAAEIRRTGAWFRRPSTGHRNKAAAATSRNIARYRRKREAA